MRERGRSAEVVEEVAEGGLPLSAWQRLLDLAWVSLVLVPPTTLAGFAVYLYGGWGLAVGAPVLAFAWFFDLAWRGASSGELAFEVVASIWLALPIVACGAVLWAVASAGWGLAGVGSALGYPDWQVLLTALGGAALCVYGVRCGRSRRIPLTPGRVSLAGVLAGLLLVGWIRDHRANLPGRPLLEDVDARALVEAGRAARAQSGLSGAYLDANQAAKVPAAWLADWVTPHGPYRPISEIPPAFRRLKPLAFQVSATSVELLFYDPQLKGYYDHFSLIITDPEGPDVTRIRENNGMFQINRELEPGIWSHLVHH